MSIFVIGICFSASATIINVPDDYETIQEGIDASADGDTVLVQPGTYWGFIIVESKNIVIGSLYLTTGDSAFIASTILDGYQLGPVVNCMCQDSTAMLIGFTIQNGDGAPAGGVYCCEADITICYNIIAGNNGSIGGGGITCQNCTPLISNNLIIGNTTSDPDPFATSGAGIELSHADAIVTNNVIIENDAGLWGGGISCLDSNPLICNNIISNNSARSQVSKGGAIFFYCCNNPLLANNVINGNSAASGGGIFCNISTPVITNNTITANISTVGGGFFGEHSDALISNSIFWGNYAQYGPEISYSGGLPEFRYCNIQGGWEGEGNIDVDPLFRDPNNGDFHLMAIECGDPYDSPCIDAGHPDILDSLLDCDWGLGELRSDMGAYGGGDSVQVGIANHQVQIPDRIALLQNYPNPFNATTTISFALSEPQFVTLKIYDLLGREIQTLVDEQRQGGMHTVIFNASELSSGIYFYRIQVDNYSESRRMVLLK